MKRLRIYVDTSVIGGCFDDEFKEESNAFIAKVVSGEFCLIVSDLLVAELAGAPENVQTVLERLSAANVETVDLSEEAQRLRDEYLKSGVVTIEHGNDALHVALATVNGADMIVSWNFRHIVHYDKIRGFNSVNLREGYMPLRYIRPRR